MASSEIRGRGEDRMRAAPAVSQACCTRIGCPRAYRFSGEHPASPTQWLYGLYEIVLVTLLFVTPSLLRQRWPPLNLTPASGRRTQTISPYATARSSRVLPRPPLPAPRLRRWPTPLWWDRMAGVLQLICPTAQRKYFLRQGWTGFVDLPVVPFCRRGRELHRRGIKG